jgi:hypothetical protein
MKTTVVLLPKLNYLILKGIYVEFINIVSRVALSRDDLNLGRKTT